MDESRLRLRYMRQNPAVALTVLGEDTGTRRSRCSAASSRSRTTRTWRGIDRLSIRYSGKPFHSRDARRVTAWMEPDRWTAWPLPR